MWNNSDIKQSRKKQQFKQFFARARSRVSKFFELVFDINIFTHHLKFDNRIPYMPKKKPKRYYEVSGVVANLSACNSYMIIILFSGYSVFEVIKNY